MRNIVSLFCCSLLIQSCFKEDERVIPYQGYTYAINDSIQSYQSYFDLESGKVVSVNRVNDWQLGFECSAEGWHIITNSGAFWFIYNTKQASVNDDYIPAGLRGKYDVQHKWPDSTAVGMWTDSTNGNYSGNVYILGRYINGNFEEIKKIVFLEVSDTSYSFSFEDNSVRDTVNIRKDNAYNFVYYSFTEGKQVQPEPEKTSYDMVFTSYYDLATLFGQTIPYHVGGALLNVWQTEVALDSTDTYALITAETLNSISLTPQRDVPGYRWKSVTVDLSGGGTASYAVKAGYIYIFRTAQGNYYKLRFLSYMLNGRSGFPRFEYSQLQ